MGLFKKAVMGNRIKDRFVGAGRRLNAGEKAAVDALHAKYPEVGWVRNPRVVQRGAEGGSIAEPRASSIEPGLNDFAGHKTGS
jgi:hypothetical protein